MIEVRYKARLGNNLFQYCLGRILAEGLGFKLQAQPIDGFPNTAEPVAGAIHRSPEQTLSGQRIDLHKVLSDRTARHVILDGWFQRAEYYRPHRERILRWLEFDAAIRTPDIAGGVVLSVRRRDYVQLGWALPFSYYEQAMESLVGGGGAVWIVTDDHSDPFFRHFARWKPKFFRGTPVEDLQLLAKAKRLIISQSTFGWWAAFLGEPEQVVCPRPSFGTWSVTDESREVDLIETDRFTLIECRDPYVAIGREARYQKWRALSRRIVLACNRRLGLSLPVPPP